MLQLQRVLAALVAKDAGATLQLVHVISDPVLGSLRRLLEGSPDDVEFRLRSKIDRDVAQLAEHLAQTLGASVPSNVVTGPLIAGVLGHAAAKRADLMVLGARGASFMRRLMLGSTAERLVRKSNLPMLVVKQPPHERYRRVLVAADFSASSVASLDLARAVAPHADLVLLHSYDVPYEDWMQTVEVREAALQHYQQAARQRALQDMQAFIAADGRAAADWPTVVVKGDPTLRILEQEQELDCDLIVVGKQGETVPEEFLLGSVTKHVLQQSQSDVLVVV